MAQREKELQVPETLTLCVNNCGFYGNPATNNMCQACFQAAGFASPSPPSRSSHEKASSSPARSPDPAAEAGRGGAEGPAAKVDAAAAAVVSPARRVSRCAGCRKRVGLTGFRCRCGSREGSQRPPSKQPLSEGSSLLPQPIPEIGRRDRDVDEFYAMCDPEKENLRLYGHPGGMWEVTLPAKEVPPELPEPALGINFARDTATERSRCTAWL